MEDNPQFDEWTLEMETKLDNLVKDNYEMLYEVYHSTKKYFKTWNIIRHKLLEEYNVSNQSHLDDKLKKAKRNCIFISIRLYAEQIFPWDLYDKQVKRFVNKYNKLPKQDLKKWSTFESKQRNKEIKKQEKADKKLDKFLREHYSKEDLSHYKSV